MKLRILLWSIAIALRFTSLMHPTFKERLKQHNLVVQIKLESNAIGRYYQLTDGKVTTHPSIHPAPDISMMFKNRRVAERVLTPPQDYAEIVHAGKNFQMTATGNDELLCWWLQTLGFMLSVGWKFGTDVGNGETRLVNNTNGGPVYVYVKDG